MRDNEGRETANMNIAIRSEYDTDNYGRVRVVTINSLDDMTVKTEDGRRIKGVTRQEIAVKLTDGTVREGITTSSLLTRRILNPSVKRKRNNDYMKERYNGRK